MTTVLRTKLVGSIAIRFLIDSQLTSNSYQAPPFSFIIGRFLYKCHFSVYAVFLQHNIICFYENCSYKLHNVALKIMTTDLMKTISGALTHLLSVRQNWTF